MECVNANCQKRERLKQLFTYEERASGYFEFCPFCSSRLVSEASNDGKRDLQESQVPHEATNITKEEGAVLQSEEHQKDVLNVKETKKGEINISAEFKNESSSDPNSSSATPLSVENTNNPTISREPAKTSLSDENQTSPDTHNDSDNFERDNDIPHVSTETDVGNSPIAKDTSQHPASVQHKDDSQCQVPTQSALNNVSENAGPEKQTVHSRGNDDSQIRTLDGESSAGQTLASHLNEGHISSAPNDEHINLPANDTSNNISGEKMSLQEEAIGMEKLPLHSTAVDQDASHHMDQNTSIPSSGQQDSAGKEVNEEATTALDSKPVAVDQNSSASNHSSVTQIVDNHSVTMTTSPPSAEKQQTLQAVTTHSKSQRDVRYPPGHDNSSASSGSSILGNNCVFGPDSQTFSQLDNGQRSTEHPETSNSGTRPVQETEITVEAHVECEKLPAAQAISDKSDTSSSDEEEVDEFQKTSGPQRYDKEVIKQKRKEREMKRKRSAKTANVKKCKEKDTIEDMDVNELEASSDAQKPKKSKSNGNPNSSIQEPAVNPPKASSDPSDPSSVPKAFVHEVVDLTRKPGSGSGPDDNTSTLEQTTSHDSDVTSAERNVSSTTPSSAGASNNSTSQTSDSYNQPTIIKGIVSPTKNNVMGDEDCATIVFHALLSPDFPFNPTKEIVTVLLGHEELGKWKSIYTIFDVEKLESKYVLVTGELQLPIRLLTRPIPYKYVVINTNNDTVNWEYSEFSDNYPGQIVNRSLHLMEGWKQKNAMWHQYDGVVYPEPPKESKLKFWRRGKYVQFDYGQLVKNRQGATNFFLPKWHGFVQGGTDQMTALEAIARIKHLGECMKYPHVFAGHVYYKMTIGFQDLDIEKIIVDFLKPKLSHNARLKEEDLKDPKVRINRLVSSLAIAYLTWYFKLDLLYVDLIGIINCLTLGSTSPNRCDFDDIHMIFPENTWSEFSEAIVHLLKCANQKTLSGRYCPDNILAVPILHFFCGERPFEEPDHGDEISVEKWCHLNQFPNYRSNERMVTQYLPKSLQMFSMDPYFRRFFLCRVQFEDFAKVVSNDVFPFHELFKVLGFKVRASQLSTYGKAKVIEECLSKMTVRIKENIERHQVNAEEWLHLSQSAQFLIQELYKRDKGDKASDDVSLCIIKLISLILWGIDQQSKSNQSQMYKEKSESIFNSLLSEVEKAMDKELAFQMPSYLTGQKEELKVWSKLLESRFLVDEHNTKWNNELLLNFERRLKKLKPTVSIDLFCEMEKTDGINACLVEVITNHAFVEVEKIVENETSERSITILRDNLRHGTISSRAGELLSRIVVSARSKALSRFKGNPQNELLFILKWKPLPGFINSFGSFDNQKMLSTDAAELVQNVMTYIHLMQQAIRDRSIDVQTSILLRQHQDSFQNLCIALTKIKDFEQSTTFLKAEIVMKELQKRIEELERFQEIRDHIHNFLNICQSSKEAIFNTQELQERSDASISEMRLVDICQRDPEEEGGQISVTFFDLPEDLCVILPQLSSVQKSIGFQKFWKKNSRVAYKEKSNDELEGEGLTLVEIHKKVLEPSLVSWQQLSIKLFDGSLSLREIDKHFVKIPTKEEMEKELKIMFGPFKIAEHEVRKKMESRLKQIEEYKKLQEYIEAAETIWNFKEALSLKGDFKIIMQLRNQTSQEFKDKTLESIDHKFVEAAQFLNTISIEKSRCLQAVIDCEPLVKWLRETIKDTSALSTLVDLAMISAGENDMEVDRISNFHTSCLNFAPLVFDIDENIGFDDLMKVCQPVWHAVDDDKHLPEKLSETNRHLEWLKAVQSSHGSVEMSSLMQTKRINTYGVYSIGKISTSSDGKIGLESVLRLNVPMDERVQGPDRIDDQYLECEDKEESKTYSLNDLKTLQSKLMLIAGKTVKLRQKDSMESTEEINRFVEILEGAMRLGQVYIDLREAGDVKYLDWQEEVNCGEDAKLISTHRHVSKKLNATCLEMEERLKLWRQYVHDRRQRFQELNHFTTQQILVLRRELGALRDAGASLDQLPLHIYALLESVLSGTTSHHLLKVLNTVPGFSLDAASTESDGQTSPDQMDLGSRDTDTSYDSFFTNLEKMEFGEDVGIAALKAMNVLQGQEFNETDLLDWCMENGENSEEIDALVEQAREDPNYIDFFPELKEEPIEADEQENDSEMLTGTEEHHTEDFPDLDVPHKSYLTLDQLGDVLSQLHTMGTRPKERNFPDYLKRDQPNLVLVQSGDILTTVLTLYKKYGEETMPTSNEVILCTSETTAEEVELFWWRAFQDVHKQIFCLVNPDVLDYSVSQRSVYMFNVLQKQFGASQERRIVVICSTENEDRSHIIAAFDEYRVHATPSCATNDVLRSYLADQLTCSSARNGYYKDQEIDWHPASYLDTDKRSVRVISSERAGVGKTLVVSRLCERLMRLPNNVQMSKLKRPKVQLSVVVPLHGTTADTQQILDALWQHPVESNLPVSRIIHIDVSPSINEGLETVLFNLVVLGVLQDKTGCLWRRRSSDLYVIEMTNNLSKASSESKKTSFASLFPTIDCITPVQTLHQLKSKETKSSPSPLFDHQEFGSVPVQRAFQYLLQCDRGQSLDRYQYDPRKQMGTPFECLALIIKHCGISDPSWCELKHFIDFLNSQLQDCEESYYTNAANVDDQWMQGTMRGFKSFVVRFMVTMSRDFATPSLDDSPSIVCSAGLSGNDVDEDIRPLQLRRRWESSPHPYIFFNQDRITMTFLGFHVNSAGDLIDPDTNIVIDRGLMTKQLQQGLALQKVDFNTNYNNWTKSQRIEKLCMVMGLKFKKDFDPDPSYELTIDNMKKILAIHMRFRCGIPVVIMGETGCGKTQLIRYMCALQAGSAGQRNMLLMKVHGGTSYHDIRRKVEQAEKMAATNEKQGIDTVLFFDEANTTDALGMIKEVMVDRRINGRPIGVGLRRLHFIAACNPYRRHTDKMIEKLESAGLGYSVKANETKDKLGKIPLRHLVYRVHALPASMRPLVWDFGQLKPEIETLYISQIVSRYVIVNRVIPGNDGLVKAIAQVLAAAQKYMRQQQDECSFVSLRDVERAMTVMTWFYQHRDHLRPEIPQSDDSDEEDQAEQVQRMDVITWSLLLSLGVCYHAKLQDRKPFRERIITSCRTPIKPTGGQEEMLNEINRCQKVLIDELNLGPNIARNTALSENVFMMVVCIELRIPLFVIGKPGSSKSLAKTVVADNMQGDASKSPLFKKFKRAHMVSYQCSPLSNPEGIVATFRQCRRLQDNNSVDRYASVVVLDEVGLAEDSPLLPLKTLHPLLEDGVTSSDDVIETDEKPTRVAFIGISNWALDPAKMNRGLMLMRGEPDKKELADSAWGICSEREDIRNILSTLLKKLAAGYAALYKKQKDFQSLSSSKRDEFFGLRDFYSLVKMVYSIAADKDDMLSWQELDHAIRRNFGGLDEVDAVKIIAKHVKSLFHHGETQDGMPVKTLDLLRASLDHENAIGESRYLLVITENYSALPIVEQELIKNKDDYVVIFGSSFPKDQEYTQVCRNINQIKVCMETGRTVVLLNLESLYESLYDALNQYYVYCAGQKYVDLGLGSHRVKCRVDDTFRLIVIAEKDVVYKKFPIPLINRLEKHYLVTAKSLGPAELDLVKDLEKWAQEFATVRSYRHERHQAFHIGDAIIGYQSDTVPSMVLQICGRDNNTQDTPDTWTEQVKNECQSLLIQCATPDGIVRLPKTTLRDKAEEIQNLYFVEQEHSSLSAYLRSLFTSLNDEEEQGVLVQVSTHSRLLSENDLNDVYDATNLRRGDIKLLHLQQFQTEQQFLKQIREFFIELANNEGMLVVQCDSGDENFNLIACTRHLLIDQCVKRQELLMEKLQLQADSIRALHVVIVVQLPRLKGGCTNFVGFQGGRWKSVHIDDLRPQLLPIESSIDRPISDLLRPSWITDTAELSMEEIDVEMTDETGEEEIDTDNDQLLETGNATMERFDAIVLLRRSIQAAAGRLEDDKVLTKRTIDRIDLVLNLLPENSSKMPDGPSFARSLHHKIYELLKERNEKVSGDLASQWVLKEALSGTRMHERGTFRKALQYKVLSEIEPLLAKILAFADRDCNLNLLVNQSQWLTRMWIRIFENKHMNEKYFDVSDTNMIRERVNMSGRGRHVFQCRFPFSWLVKDMVDGLARGAADVSSRSSGHETEVERIRNILRNSDLSDIFDCVSEEGQEEEAAQRYLHDFVHMVYYPTRQSQEQEIQLVSQYIMMTAESENEQDGFIFDIATIHVTYSNLQTRINSFNQLIQAQPDITRLMLSQRRQMTRSIDVAALIVFLETLEPNMSELSRAEARNIWCGKVLSVRSSIEEMTSQSVFSSAYEDDEKELMLKCWNMWQRLSVVRLFITHVLNASLQEKDTLKCLEMIAKVFGQDTNFLTERSVVALERFLLECSQDFKKRNQLCDTTCSICKEESKSPTLSPCGHCFCMDCITRSVKDNNSCPECRQQLDGFKPTESQEIKNSCDQINKFRDHCNSFFMEVVSLFCFGYSPCGTLQENTFQRLMSYVTGKEGTQTKPFSPFSDSMDVTPVVRSFLFQQLLRSSDRKVKEYMEQFIMRAQDVAEFGIGAAEVYAMSIQCMEDAYNSNVVKRTSELSLDKKLKLIETKYCKKAEATTRIPIPDAVDVEWLEGIAIIRFSLTFVAELMYKVAQDDKDVLQDNVKPILHSIFGGIERICRRPTLDKPVLFLLKQLSRRYGFDSIYHVAKTFNWILPEELTDSFEVSQDQFLVYGQQYQQLRETVARSIVDGDLEAISNSLQNMTWGVNLKNIVVVLALFHEITLNPNVQIADVVMENLRNFIQQSSDITPWCKQLSEELISDDEHYPRTITRICGLAADDAWHANMVKIIIHLAVVLQIRRNNGPVGPLAALAFQPDSCINSFLPTMPDDTRQEIRQATGGVIHECPNGHPYVITECGRPMERSRCKAPGCGAEIGGDNHRLVANNRASSTEDQTRKGHCLGFPANRERTAVPERGLTPLATCLIRLLVHGSMLIGSCFHLQTVSQLISPNIPPNDVHRFLWDHLMRDMTLLSNVSGRSVDEISVIVHLLLENISIFNSMNMPTGLTVLRNKIQRGQWETFFANTIIGQVMNNLGIRMQETMRLITNDDRFGSNPLLRQLYELEAGVEDPGTAITPNCSTLWRYRTPITLDHVTRKFNESSDSQSKDCVILGEFLKQERELRAVKLLPDVVKLQRLLMDRYHRSLDRTQTDKLQLKDFYKQIPKGSVNEYKALVKSFRDAWNIMVASIREKGTEGPLKKLSENEVKDTTPISMLIPTVSGLGACSLELTRFLVATNNDFFEAYKRYSHVRDLPTVSVTEVTRSQLLSYDPDQDLLPLVHAHCHYSLEIGQGTSVEYDWPAVQRHLIDRLIRGRSLIDFKADEYTRTAVINAESVITSLKVKIPQVELSLAIQHQIVQQYRSLQDVCDALSSLNIAITFLSSGGGRPTMLLTHYLHNVLKLPEDAALRNHKAKEVCQLQHAVSLWRLLSIERARRLTRDAKDPFEHLSDEFKKPVVETLQMTASQSLRELNEVDLDSMVALLIEIITLKLNEEFDIDKQYSLKDYIEYNPLYHDQDISSYVEHIPDDVQLQHVFGFWQLVINQRDKSHERRIQATG